MNGVNSSAMTQTYITLNDGNKIPQMGIGVFMIPNDNYFDKITLLVCSFENDMVFVSDLLQQQCSLLSRKQSSIHAQNFVAAQNKRHLVRKFELSFVVYKYCIYIKKKKIFFFFFHFEIHKQKVIMNKKQKVTRIYRK